MGNYQRRVELMRHNLIEAILGAVVLVVASYFLIFAYAAGSHRMEKGYTLKAKFDRIDGLSPGNDIKISGVRVGTVDKIDVDTQSYQAIVHLNIKDSIKIPNDSMAEIVSESLLGGKYIAIVPGISTDMLNANEQLAKTLSAVNFETLISRFLFNKQEEQKK